MIKQNRVKLNGSLKTRSRVSKMERIVNSDWGTAKCYVLRIMVLL